MRTTAARAALAASLAGLALSGCSPFYVLRAAYEEGRILAGRRKIESVIEDPRTTAAEREKLMLVPQARAFAREIGLTPGGSFTRFSRVSRDVLAWVLMASRPDAFELHSWWFPVAGRLPYKGFFERKDADAAARSLEAKGFETYIRPTDAFSTLGWFDDPLLSTTLRHDETRIVEIVIHETLHSTIWIGDAVDFNESLANFVGTRASVDFFESLAAQAPGEAARTKALTLLQRACQGLHSEAALEKIVTSLYNDLAALYESAQSRETKLARRGEIFEQYIAPLRSKNPHMQIFRQINNAEIMQLKIYLTGFSKFEKLFGMCSADWRKFLDELKVLSREIDQSEGPGPWELLDRRLKEEQGV